MSPNRPTSLAPSGTFLVSLKRKLAALRPYRITLILILLLFVLVAGPGQVSSSSGVIPTFSIQSVVKDDSVTILTQNFPAGQTFAVTMGPMGTLGIDGYWVASTNSGAGGTFTATYTIPEQLRGSYQISIRLQSMQGYYAYNWFYNNSTNSNLSAPGNYSGIPTFNITAVTKNETVTIKTNNFPANQTFTLRMGAMGTQGIGGIVVETFNSGAGGIFERTFAIPDALKDSYQIAIRAETAHANPYYAYNWFYNNSTNSPASAANDYIGIPTFNITAVTKNETVTIKTNNFPANQTFTLRMGAMGTKGIGGIIVETFDSGTGGIFERTFDIPDALKDSYQIAIRAETAHANPYYAYNWFYNNSTAGGSGDEPVETTAYVYTGIPTIHMCTVVRNSSVMFRTNNFPPNQNFTVRMGPMGTAGIGGYVVGSFNSGAGGTFDKTFNIPASLAGSYQISIRAETAHAYPFYAFNWFYNNTASVCN